MSSFTIRDFDDALKQKLRQRAAERNRSMEEEARDILRCALAAEEEISENLVDMIRRLVEPLGGSSCHCRRGDRSASRQISRDRRRYKCSIGDDAAASIIGCTDVDAVGTINERVYDCHYGGGAAVGDSAAARRQAPPIAGGGCHRDPHGRFCRAHPAVRQRRAREFADIAADRRRAGRPIAEADARIAAIARSRGADLATRDVGGFAGCGIRLIDPWQ